MFELFCEIIFIFEFSFATQSPSSQSTLPSSQSFLDFEFDISGAHRRAQAARLATSDTPETDGTTSLGSRPSVELEFDVSAAYSRHLLRTTTSFMDFSTSRPVSRSKIASNLYFDENVPMYRIPTEIVYRQGSPTEIRYRTKLPRNTWSIFSQQGTSTPGSPSTAVANRRKREATSTISDRATWTEILFRQNSPTEIRYHTRRNPTWSVFSQQNSQGNASTISIKRKRQVAPSNLRSNVMWMYHQRDSRGNLESQKTEKQREVTEFPKNKVTWTIYSQQGTDSTVATPTRRKREIESSRQQESADLRDTRSDEPSLHHRPGKLSQEASDESSNADSYEFPPKGNWSYFGNFYWEPNKNEMWNTLQNLHNLNDGGF